MPVGERPGAARRIHARIACRFNHLYGREPELLRTSAIGGGQEGFSAAKRAKLLRGVLRPYAGTHDEEARALGNGRALLDGRERLAGRPRAPRSATSEGSGKMITRRARVAAPRAPSMPKPSTGTKMSGPTAYHRPARRGWTVVAKDPQPCRPIRHRVRRNRSGQSGEVPVWQFHRLPDDKTREQT